MTSSGDYFPPPAAEPGPDMPDPQQDFPAPLGTPASASSAPETPSTGSRFREDQATAPAQQPAVPNLPRVRHGAPRPPQPTQQSQPQATRPPQPGPSQGQGGQGQPPQGRPQQSPQGQPQASGQPPRQPFGPASQQGQGGAPNMGRPPLTRPSADQQPPQPRQQGAGQPPQQPVQQRPSFPRPSAQTRQQPPVQERPQASLSAESLFNQINQGRPEVRRPEKGFRRFLYDLTNGRVNPGPSEVEQRRADLVRRIQTPLPGGSVHHVAVWSQKGGVGKTTTATTQGITMAMNRTDKILGLDVNPDGGSMAVRVPRTTKKTIVDLRNALRNALRSGYVAPADFDRYVNHASHRLDTIVMPPGEKVERDQILTGDDYLMIAEALETRYPYKIIFTDCGTNLTDSVMDGVLAKTHQLIVVTTTVMDEATVTAGGLEALAGEGYGHLVRNAITILVEKAPRDPNVEVQRQIDATTAEIEQWFESITGTVVRMPYDSRIRIGGVIDPETISEKSQFAHLEVAAKIVENLAARNDS